ncbi:MAG: rhomboid family intramembrane serine protease [Myxococcales bacterium]|jgi:membrane associated rhomboid family serine protease|nr:rhomboid family intramembrane serine protease [Myxococcales bacterium]
MSFDTGSIFRKPPPGTLWLMALTAGLSLIALASSGRFGSSSLASALLFSPSAVLDAHRLWTPLTYLFVSLSPLQLIFYVLFGLWMFAAQLERQWGTRRFLYFFFMTGVSAAVITTLLGTFSSSLRGVPALHIGGTGIAFQTILLAWVLMNWHASVFFFFLPVRAPFLLVIALLFPFFSIVQGDWEATVPVLTSMAIGFLMLQRRNPLRKLWLQIKLAWAQAELKRSRARRHLRVVQDQEQRQDDEKEVARKDERKPPPTYLN